MRRLKATSTYFLILVQALINAGLALALKQIVDVSVSKKLDEFLHYLLLLLLLFAVDFAVSNLARYRILQAVQKDLLQCKDNYMRHLLYGGDEAGTAAFSADIDLLYSDYFMNRYLLVFYSLQLLVSLLAMLYINWLIALLSLGTAFLPLLIARSFTFMQKAAARYSKSMETYLGQVEDVLAGRREIKSYFAQAFFLQRHQKQALASEKERSNYKFTIYFYNKLLEFLGMSSLVATVCLCGYLTIIDVITIGSLIAFIQLTNSVLGPVQNIGACRNGMKASVKLLEKYKIDTAQVMKAEKKAITKIELNALSFAYNEQGGHVLTDVNLRFEAGKKYLVVAESGQGKTTLAKLMAGELLPSQGEIKIMTDSGEMLRPAEITANVHYLSQNPHLFHLTALENIIFGEEEKCEAVLTKANHLGISALCRDERVLEWEETVSGGQKQRLAVLRVLCREYPVMIFDEPTAGLDSENSARLLEEIVQLPCSILLVISHHYPEDILAKFDEIIRLS